MMSRTFQADGKVMRIFLADDHPLLRMGLRLALEQEEGIELIGEASDGFSAVDKIRDCRPDLCLIDVDMPGMSGIRVVRLLKKEAADFRILILSTYDDEKYVQDAIRAGANGYVLKCVAVPELVRIIRSVCKGEKIVSPYLINLAVDPNDSRTSPHADKVHLTSREKEILKAVIDGLSNKEISDRFHISLETVKSHTKNIYQKLQVRNRVEAAMTATKLDLF